MSFIDGVLGILERPESSECSPSCPWCGYINKMGGPQIPKN